MATQWTAGTTAGQVLTAATLNTIGAVWETYTPTLTQTATVTKTVASARYCQFQKTVIVSIQMVVTGAGTAGTGILVGLPIAARGTGIGLAASTGYIYDASVNVMYNCTGVINASTTMGFYYQSGFFVGQSPNFALANTDQIGVFAVYEAA